MLEHAPLHNAEQGGSIAFMGILAAFGPAQGQLHGVTGFFLSGRVWGALVKYHDNIGAQVFLHLHGYFRCKNHGAAVHRRLEFHPFFTDFAHLAQGKHLKTAGIGENRTLPLHKVVQVAMLLDDLGTRAQHKVEGVAQDDLGSDGFYVPG